MSPDNHPVHYYPVTKKDRFIGVITVVTAIITVVVFCALLVFLIFAITRTVRAEPETPTDQYYSASVYMDGTVDINHATFSWTPALMPGYQLDTRNTNCIGSVRTLLNHYACVDYYWYEPEEGKWYFVTWGIPRTVCGLPEVWLQPFLNIYNPITGAYDSIYGSTEIVDFTYCNKFMLPTIIK